MSDAPLLEVTDLQTHFATADGVVRSVDGVSFTLNAGEVLGVVGESGSGKSVTGLSILGLVAPPGRIVGGSIRFQGRELVGLDQTEMRKLRGSKIAMVFQDPMTTLNPVLRIETQMVETVLAHRPMPYAAARARALECLRSVGITAPEARLASYPHQLSGGLRQRVVIAIALLNEPELIIADEPTTALDVTIQAQILYEMQKLCARTGTAMIWVTHDLSVVAGLATRLCVMYAGRDVEQGETGRVLDRPVHPYTKGLIGAVAGRVARGALLPQIPGNPPSPLNPPPGCAFAPPCAVSAEICETAPPRVAAPDGGWYRCHRPDAVLPAAPHLTGTPRHAAAMDAAPLLQLHGISKHFTPGAKFLAGPLAKLGLGTPPAVLRAVQDVTLSVAPGEILGIAGESGCGKSTLARMVAGIIPPSTGDIRFDGQPLSTLHGGTKTVRDLPVQMVFQDPYASLNPRLRVRTIIGTAPRLHNIVTAAEREDEMDAMMRRCGLDLAMKTRFPHQFSGGQRQRIGIARALAVKPRLLVCDESVSALDVSVRAQIINLFLELRAELDLTYLFISHDLGVLEHISDRIMIMYLGRVVEVAPADSVFRQPRHPYTKALVDEIPRLERRHVSYTPIHGDLPSPLAPPPGCAFHPRCDRATDRCREETPVLLPDNGAGQGPMRLAACHHPLG